MRSPPKSGDTLPLHNPCALWAHHVMEPPRRSIGGVLRWRDNFRIGAACARRNKTSRHDPPQKTSSFSLAAICGPRATSAITLSPLSGLRRLIPPRIAPASNIQPSAAPPSCPGNAFLS
uniref:Uncharacterized protein n=1 Tax=Plectus sambesii TaxID=2011161 RepID=A0A914WVN9_9BILA